MLKTLSKIGLWCVAAVVVFILLAGIFLQTSTFRSWLKGRLESMANANLNGTLHIGTLSGNLFTRFELADVSLVMQETPFVRLKRLAVHYNPMLLLNRRIEVHDVTLDSLGVVLARADTSGWVWSHLLKHNTDGDGKATTLDPDTNSGWTISAPSIKIVNADLAVDPVASPMRIPRRVTDLNLVLGFWVDSDEVRAAFERLSFRTESPDLQVRTVETKASYREQAIHAEGIHIKTDSTEIDSKVDIQNLKSPTFDVLLKTAPLALSEVRRLLPTVDLYGNPRFDVSVKGPLSRLEINAGMAVERGRIEISGILQAGQSPVAYDMTIRANHLDLATHFNNPTLQSDLNLRATVRGKGLALNEMANRFRVDVDSSRIFDTTISAAKFAGGFGRNSLTLSTSLRSRGAILQADGLLTDITGRPVLELAGSLEHLELGRWFQLEGISSDLGGKFKLAATGLAPEIATLDLKLTPSLLNQIPIDSSTIQLVYTDSALTLKRLELGSPLAFLTATGSMIPAGEVKLDLETDVFDLGVLEKAMQVDSLYGWGRLRGSVSGMTDSLAIVTELMLSDAGIADVTVGRLEMQGSGLSSANSFAFDLDGVLSGVSGFGLSDMHATTYVGYADSVTTARVGFSVTQELAGEILTDFQSREEGGYVFTIKDLVLTYLGQRWVKTDDLTTIAWSEEGLVFQGLQLFADDQRALVDGTFNQAGNNDLSVRVDNLLIDPFVERFGPELQLSGRFDLASKLTGSLARPVITTHFRLWDATYLEVPFSHFEGNVALSSDSLDWDCALSKAMNDSLFQSSGHLPVRFSSDSGDFSLDRDTPFFFKFNSRGLDLSIADPFIKDMRNLQGTLIADIVLSNTLNAPRGVGPIRIVDGRCDLPEFGLKYRDINVASFLKERELVLRQVHLGSGRGNLTLEEGSLSLSERGLEDFHAKFRLKDFELMRNRKMEATVKGALQLSGSLRSPSISGELTVIESRIYYSAWLEEETAVKLTTRPFFVIDPDSALIDSSGALRFQKKAQTVERYFTDLPVYKNLTGEVVVNFPRDSWVRSADTNIEISGELVVVKEKEELLLFGTLAANRGFYRLFGNRFQVERGELVFYGEPEPDPEVDIEAVYTFRDPGENADKHEFRVFVTGTLYTPQFKFTLDQQEAKQQDILSVLIFGQSSQSLPFGQQDAVAGRPLDQKAMGLVTDQVLQALSGRLGRELGLDFFQVESGDSFEETRLQIGKYITPDVFVSLSQDFNQEGNQRVELEYEIPRKLLFFKLLLQATQDTRGDSGLDLIWKIDW